MIEDLSGCFLTTNFDQEMLDFIREHHSRHHVLGHDLTIVDDVLNYSHEIDSFFTDNSTVHESNYKELTKQEFKERIGMGVDYVHRESITVKVTLDKEGTITVSTSNEVYECKNLNEFGELSNALMITHKFKSHT